MRSEHDPCVYSKEITKYNFMYFLLYVDDMLIAASYMTEVKELKKQLSSAFEMKDLGPTRRILGMNIVRDRRRRFVTCLNQNILRK